MAKKLTPAQKARRNSKRKQDGEAKVYGFRKEKGEASTQTYDRRTEKGRAERLALEKNVVTMDRSPSTTVLEIYLKTISYTGKK